MNALHSSPPPSPGAGGGVGMPTRARALLQTQLKRLQDGLRRVHWQLGKEERDTGQCYWIAHVNRNKHGNATLGSHEHLMQKD